MKHESIPAHIEIAYNNALDAFRVAAKAFRETTEAYRARKVGDAEFLAARRDMQSAQARMDHAETEYRIASHS